MSASTQERQHRTSRARTPLRWAVPVVVAALVAGGAFASQAQAEPPLPPKTAEQLLVDLQNPTATAFSGTVRSDVDLGLPAIPGAGEGPGSLLTGSNTVRVWVDGTNAKAAITKGSDEWAVIKGENDVWIWSSAERKATHATVPEGEKTSKQRPGTPEYTPQQLAQKFLAAVEPDTEVSTNRTTTVAGRAAYELVLTPTSADTKIGSVSIAVDATTNMALRTQVWAKGADAPAIDVGFTDFSDARPDASVFTFTPPPGVEVEEVTPGEHQKREGQQGEGKQGERPEVIGSGWSQVVIAKLPSPGAGNTEPNQGGERGGEAQQWQQMIDQLPTVSGSWGGGKLLEGSLFSVVLTNDGRVAAGAVTADHLVSVIPG
ncbi:LolA family protein [Propionibacteriaceae bacterium Y2011]